MNREIILLLFPVLAAFFIPIGTLVSRNFGKLIILISFLAGIVYSIILFPGIMMQSKSVIIGNWMPPFGINLFFSPLTLGTAALIYGIASLVLFYDIQNTDPKRGQYYLLYSLFVTASIGLVLTGDLFNIFVFLEIAGITSFALIAAGDKNAGPSGSLKYLIQVQLSTLIMAAGIALLYSATGVLNIANLAKFNLLNPAFAFLTAVLILLPVFLLAKLFPLNSWVGGAYDGAVSSFCASLSGIMTAVGTILLARFMLTLMNGESAFAAATESLRLFVLVSGSATIIVGELAAFKEKNLKKLLAFSSIGQMGMIAVGIGAANLASVKGALLLLLSHSMAKVLLFLVAGFLIRKSSTVYWKEMKGIGRRLPFAGGFFMVGAMTLTGIPLFPGFWGKLEIVKGIASSGNVSIIGAVAVLLGTVIEGIYFIRISHCFFERGKNRKKAQHNLGLFVPALIISAALILVGLFPGLIDSWFASAVQELLHPVSNYVDIILKTGAGS